ncbi:hypothetical protein, partial [Acinetobacter baumannii]|uniref:hypothetical protein n=1 Tax=Acinetobacter baumannii TaxID=470 RepID=UPI0011C08038
MATASTVPKTIIFPSNNAVPLTPKISSSSMKFNPKLKMGLMGLSKRSRIVAMAGPPPAKEEKLTEAVEKSIENAREKCAEDEKSGE